MSFLPDNEGLSNFEVAELDKEIRDVVGIVESQVNFLIGMILMQNSYLLPQIHLVIGLSRIEFLSW